jgi:hypothetical protein
VNDSPLIREGVIANECSSSNSISIGGNKYRRDVEPVSVPCRSFIQGECVCLDF